MPKIYIIIVTYNAMKWAERCFTSLRKSSVPVNCIVVDNGSTDGTQDYIKTNFPEVELIQSLENLGFGRANNIGIEKAYKAGADFFYLMNQDAWIFENSVAEMLYVYNQYPNKDEIGLLSPMHLDGSEKLLDLHFERYLGKDVHQNRLLSSLFLDIVNDWYEVDFVNAAHWFIPKNTIEKTGGFNPYFFHNAEDYDYVFRLKYYKKKILVCPKSTVVHDTVQGFHKKEPANAKEKLAVKRLSMRKQRENRYLNPAYNFDIKKERKEFLSNIVKLTLKGNIEEAKYYYKLLKFFEPKFESIERFRKIAMNDFSPFLNLEKTK